MEGRVGEARPPDLKACFFSLDGWLLYEFYGTSTVRVLVNASSGAATKVPPRRRRLDDDDGAASTTPLKRKMMPSRGGLQGPPPRWWFFFFTFPPYHRGHGRWYEDVAFHRGKLYTLTIKEDLFALEVIGGEIAGESQDEHVIKAESSPPTTDLEEERPSEMRYLVVSSCMWGKAADGEMECSWLP
ncbi:hypothetical protein BAE44_0013573 [Dichanthelium oligosanthes]|uniref:F-box associated domain-containing protein n=1 Tax=Dichanthelium oligosanthes TaxID=888268 RepID=A0A1E5VJX5_9POAL|nr:hypothetical protein BAE44_0013573 [Dichanthelium oligosanthes]